MKTSIKLVVIYFLILQVVAPLLVAIPCTLYSVVTTGNLDKTVLTQMIIIPSQLVGILLMTVYLWKSGYISREKAAWAPISPTYLSLSVIIQLSLTWLLSALMTHLKWIPNIMEQTFDSLFTSWVGILAVAVAGPVLEELLFRGVITKALLQQYQPKKAILISALIFGFFHINPAQILPAFLMGLLFAWIYYQTASLIPCLLMHILNNSAAIYVVLHYPDVDEIDQLVSGGLHLFITCLASLLVVLCYTWMRRTKIAYPWQKETLEENSSDSSY